MMLMSPLVHTLITAAYHRANQTVLDAIYGAILVGITQLADTMPDLGLAQFQITLFFHRCKYGHIPSTMHALGKPTK